MTTDGFDLIPLLDYIDPAVLTYQEWVNVGMALKHEGISVDEWDRWSARDPARYHPGDCEQKWQSFNGSAAPVTGGTIVQMAKEAGWRPSRRDDDDPLDWDGVIGGDYKVVDNAWLEGVELSIPDKWEPAKQLIKYLETLFEAGETVGYVTETWEKDGKYIPTSGVYSRTAGELIEALSKCGSDIGSVVGDYKPEAGAWIRFNPLDGKGVKNANVTEYRYALVESDVTDITHQNQILRDLELPIACLVYSGGKSIHAIVRIDAIDYTEYRKRVDFLYSVCEKNGLKVDKQNKNPSRLSRMPGVMRNGEKQYLLDVNIGKESFNEWKEWIESINDDLPDPESVADVWDDLPELSPPLIDGILRQGHKMLVAGPSKAGKSFALIELCCAIAEGSSWFGFGCTQGKVLYVNLELDRASCLHRFKDVYTALRLPPRHLSNIDIWNLRGRSVPMDKLAPKLIRRALKKNYIAVIIDPIYKVITGDENSADQMAHFCNQFDKVCTELGCAVIYCHHHSKGTQGSKKSMDRASGSGVFARDPDALLDLIELSISDANITAETDKAVCAVCGKYLDRFHVDVSPDERCSEREMLRLCHEQLPETTYRLMEREADALRESRKTLTAWRIEGTLREFPKFEPVNLWFDYPIHRIDDCGALMDVNPDGEHTFWKQGQEKRKKRAEKERSVRKEEFDQVFSAIADNDVVSIQDIADDLGVSNKYIGAWFGHGKNARDAYKNAYEVFTGDDGRRYLKKKRGASV